jgi:hypothetical protein
VTNPNLIFSTWQPEGCDAPAVLKVEIFLDAEGRIVSVGLNAQPGLETAAARVAYYLGAETGKRIIMEGKP